MEEDKSIIYYENAINNQIKIAKSEFKFVYQILHPFEINTDGKDGIHHEKLEDKVFRYQVSNLILKYFGTLEGFSLKVPIDDYLAIENITDNFYNIPDTISYFSIKRNRKRLNKEDHIDFYKELQKIAYPYFTKRENWDYYTDDDLINVKFWNWEKMTWESLCKKLQIPFDSSIRFSRIWSWINQNGYPTNIRFPKDLLEDEIKSEIEKIADKLSAKIILSTNYEARVTIIGCSADIKEALTDLGVEFTDET